MVKPVPIRVTVTRLAWLSDPRQSFRTRSDRHTCRSRPCERDFLYDVLTFGLRTRNPFHLIMIFLFGVIPFVFLAFLVLGTLSSGIPSNWSVLILPVFLLVATGALTINFALSILHIIGILHRPK